MPDARLTLTVAMERGDTFCHLIWLRAPGSIVFDDNPLATQPLPERCFTRLPANVCTCGQYYLVMEGPERAALRETVREAFQRDPSGRLAATVIQTAPHPSDWTDGFPENFLAWAASQGEWSRTRDGSGLEARAIADDHDDHVRTLVDFARQGREQDFRDLGAMLGVDKGALDDLWRGTVARLKT